MKSFIAPAYTFTPGASGVGTVNLSGISAFNIKFLVSIINQTTGDLVYSTASAALRYTNVVGTTVTLFKDTSAMSAGDVLQVIYQLPDAELVSGNVPSLIKVKKKDGTIVVPVSTENNALAVGNFIQKFRDGFVTAQPDLTVWDQVWVNQGSSLVAAGGNSSGSSYMKISMCPITASSEYFLTSKASFRFPVRFAYGLTLSQRILGQETELSLVGVDGSSVVETIPAVADLSILGTVAVASNVATINFSAAHGLTGGDRVILVGNADPRLNVGPVVVTVVSTTQITVPLTLANASYLSLIHI